MANPLTGDFDVVLQVSGSTINRLLASMHQNTDPTSDLPRFPHNVGMRIGDPTPIDGMRGTAWAQLSVPRIDLIHGEDDRFNLEVGIRVRYKPDPGTTLLPEFIHGTVRAQYRIDKIDPNCWGWGKTAGDYIWIRVVPPTVSFDGTAVDDTSPFTFVQPPDPAVVDARITRLVTYLLKKKFQATPQKVEGRFRRGSMRSLNVGVDRSAVAIPLEGQGQLTSINQDLLDGWDFGVAIDSAFIIANIQRELETFRAGYRAYLLFTSVSSIAGIDVLTLKDKITITLTSATAEWSGGTVPMLNDSIGVITIKISGKCIGYFAVFNLTFDVTQRVMLSFDAVSEGFAATLIGSPTINPHGTLAFLIGAKEKQKFADELKPRIKAEMDKFVGSLTVKDRKTDLITQLEKLDATPDAHFEEAVFSPDGVIVRGYISVSPRRPRVTEFVKTAAQDGFNAFESWIPGGRIDSFDWSWVWFNSHKPGGGAKETDRFLLRRPIGVQRSNFGVVTDLSRPLPILDGWGTMCLTIRGVCVDPVTGALVPVTTRRKCMRAGLDIRVEGVAGGRVFLKEWAKPKRDPIWPVEEVSLIDVGGGRSDRAPNTLVIRSGERWDRETGAALRDALLSSRRVDAGLQILLLFPDGTLAARGNILDEVMQFAADLAAPLTVNEDVRGTWSAALSMDARQSDVQWRLVTPTGGVSWAHDGAIEPGELARVFDNYLFPSPPASPRPFAPGILAGTRLQAAALGAALYDDMAHHFEIEDRCPPPLGPFTRDARAIFVQADSVSSQAAIERLAREYSAHEGERPFVVLIVDGGTPEGLDSLKERMPEEFVAIPDPRGTIAAQFGVRAWPTSVKVTEGVVTAVDVGAEPVSRPSDSESAS